MSEWDLEKSYLVFFGIFYFAAQLVTATYHVGRCHDARQRHGDGQLTLVADHRDQLYEPLKAIGQGGLSQRLKLRPLLQDLCEDLHEGCPALLVSMVTQPWK